MFCFKWLYKTVLHFSYVFIAEDMHVALLCSHPPPPPKSMWTHYPVLSAFILPGAHYRPVWSCSLQHGILQCHCGQESVCLQDVPLHNLLVEPVEPVSSNCLMQHIYRIILICSIFCALIRSIIYTEPAKYTTMLMMYFIHKHCSAFCWL